MTAPTPIIICDLDNCLCDDSWRIPSIRWDLSVEAGRYDAYHAQCDCDRPNRELADRLLVEASHGTVIAYFTARPETVRPKTELWLKTRGLLPKGSLLFMRPNHDHSHSRQLKRKMFEALIDPNNLYTEGLPEVRKAFDDREDVLEMYKGFGVATERIAIHNTCAYVPPMKRKMFEALIDPNNLYTEGLPEVRKAFDDREDVPPSERVRRDPFTAADVLGEMAETFRERNKVYGSNYLMVAQLVKVLFPGGVPPGLVETDQWHLFELKLVKLSRFAISHLTHLDSIHDDAVYAAMIEAILRGGKEGAQ